jgi:hypothetical protein
VTRDAPPPRGETQGGSAKPGSAAKREFSDRLVDEVAPRLEAVSRMLARGLLGMVDLDLAAGGALALADRAAEQVEVELQERELRGSTR